MKRSTIITLALFAVSLAAISGVILYKNILPMRNQRPALFDKADKAILFLGNLESDSTSPSDLKKVKSLIEKGVTLTVEQREIIENNIAIEPIESEIERDACFIPHHFIKYYKSDKQIGEVAICFCCEGVEIAGESYDNAKFYIEFKLYNIEKLLKTMDIPTNIDCN
jgi:hypothetical protein